MTPRKFFKEYKLRASYGLVQLIVVSEIFTWLVHAYLLQSALGNS